MKKRILSTLLALCMVLALLPKTAWAVDVVKSGVCGKNATWTQYSDGSVLISGTGAMNNYSVIPTPNSPWSMSSVKTVKIEEGIVNIGNCAFGWMFSLKTLEIPKSVVSIGSDAFNNSRMIKDIYYAGTEADWKNIKIASGNYTLDGATIHYNSVGSGGQGSAGEDPKPTPDPNPVPTPDPGPDVPDTNTSLHPVNILFHSGLGNVDNYISFDWGWDLFRGPAVKNTAYMTYDNRLATAGLLLSSAAENSQMRVESILGQLGFDNIVSYNYNQPGYIIAQPGVTFGHKRLIISGEEQHVFTTVVRGTTNVADFMTDVFSLAGAFQVSGQNVYDLLTTYIKSTCKLNPADIGEHTCFFVTGHSLGGATCNVLAKKLNESYGAEKVFAYTFASPTTAFSGSDVGESGNIYNILNGEDIVPLVPPTLWDRYGLSVWFSRRDYAEIYDHFASLTNNKDLRAVMESISIWIWDEFSKISYAHATETYMSFLLSLSNDVTLTGRFSGNGGGVWCPVDLEIYAKTNEGPVLVGCVKDNKIDECATKSVVLRVDGDRKYFYFPFDGEYTIKLTGSEDGVMTFFVQDMDYNTGEPIKGTGTTFEKVKLSPDKQFVSEVKIAGGVATGITDPRVKLYVLDENGKPEKEVLSDGAGTEVPVTPDLPDVPGIPDTPDTPNIPLIPGWSAASRTVTISSVTGGTVTTPTRFPYPNAWVTLTVTPDSGYELTDLTVTNRYGQTVPVHPLEDGRYGFTMPDSDVTVNPVFTKPAGSPLPGAGFGSGGYADIIYPGPAMAFTDVRPGDWFHDSVNYVYTRRLMNGVSATAFAPQGTTSRAMIWTVLARLSGLDTTGGESWYERGRIWAMNRGITDGTAPQGDITREQLVTMLWRFKGSAQLPGDALAQFSDRSDLSPYAVTAANWAVNAGLLKGDNGRLNPQGTATRAEAAAILQRLCQTAA